MQPIATSKFTSTSAATSESDITTLSARSSRSRTNSYSIGARARVSRVSVAASTAGSIGHAGRASGNPASRLLISMLAGDLVNCANFLVVQLLNMSVIKGAQQPSDYKAFQYINYLKKKFWALKNSLNSTTILIYHPTTGTPLINGIPSIHFIMFEHISTTNAVYHLEPGP